MKFSSYAATSLLVSISAINAFTVTTRTPPIPSAVKLHSTLSPEAPSFAPNGNFESDSKGAISMQIDELSLKLGGTGRAKVVWDCYSIGVDPADLFGDVINLGYDDYESVLAMLPSQRRGQRLSPDTVSKLKALYPQSRGQNKVENGVASISHISQAGDSTTKLLLKLADGLEIETVIIPWKGKRSTLCISSQVGCRQGCQFCATGRMGKQRDLTSDEILAQMFYAKKICRLNGLPDITNIVFTGMGEPADNSKNVVTATNILATRELFQLNATKVTVSTVGPSPDSFMEFAHAPCVIAWSVHAANDQLRKKLVPTTKYSMDELREGLIEALLQRPNSNNLRTTMIEIALIKGINDSLKEADELAEFTKVILQRVPGSKVIINLIPFNDIGSTMYERPDHDDVVDFQKRLQTQGLYSHIRATRGKDKLSACGQLATSKTISSKNNNNNNNNNKMP